MPVFPSTPLRRATSILCLSTLMLWGLSACGGNSSDDDDVDMPEAFALLGQDSFTGSQSNRGNSVNALGLAQPLGGVATNGSLFYVADYSNHRILGWNSIPSSSTVAPDFVIGQSDFTSNSSGTSSSKLALPASVSITDSRLVVADAGNNRVLIWNNLPTANTPADVVVGQSDFSGNDPGTGSGALNFPIAATIANNKLFVVDQYNNRVLIWNSVPDASGSDASVVLGQPDFTTATAADEEDGLTNPASLWTDGLRLLVSDSGNNRVMYWSSIPRSSGSDATYVIGQTDFSRTAAGVGQAALRTPYGVTSDGTRIYIADAENNRMIKFDSFPIANGASAVDTYGQDSYSARTPNDDDQDGASDDEPSSRTLSSPTGATYFNGVLYVTDRSNHRVLFFPD
jgi:hypothetical protein